MELKVGKAPNETSLHIPIGLLPILSRLFEKMFMCKIETIKSKNKPSDQFDSRQKYDITDQTHKIVTTVREALENKSYCKGVFLHSFRY